MAKTRRRLDDHFIVEEFDCHDGTRVPAPAHHGLELAIGWWLEPMRDEFGAVTIISGYRTETHNRDVGGAKDSMHLYHRDRVVVNFEGRKPPRPIAFDVRCAGGDVVTWSRWAASHRLRYPHLGRRGRGGIGTYRSDGFVHLDTGPLRDWRG